MAEVMAATFLLARIWLPRSRPEPAREPAFDAPPA
jgi:hypothetical protein